MVHPAGEQHLLLGGLRLPAGDTAANDMEAIKTSGLELSPKMESILSNAVQSVKNNTLYTPSAFAGGNKARKVLEYSLSDLASADRATGAGASGSRPARRRRGSGVSSPTNTLSLVWGHLHCTGEYAG